MPDSLLKKISEHLFFYLSDHVSQLLNLLNCMFFTIISRYPESKKKNWFLYLNLLKKIALFSKG